MDAYLKPAFIIAILLSWTVWASNKWKPSKRHLDRSFYSEKKVSHMKVQCFDSLLDVSPCTYINGCKTSGKWQWNNTDPQEILQSIYWLKRDLTTNWSSMILLLLLQSHEHVIIETKIPFYPPHSTLNRPRSKIHCSVTNFLESSHLKLVW